MNRYKSLITEKLLKRVIIEELITEIYVNPKSTKNFPSTVRGVIDTKGNLIIWDQLTILHFQMIEFLIKNGYIKSAHYRKNVGWLDAVILDNILPVQEFFGSKSKGHFGISESIHREFIDKNLQKINNILLKCKEKNPQFNFTPNRV